MKMERFLPILFLPNIAMAKGGGVIILGLIIFLPLFLWGMVKIWKFWFRLIFGGFANRSVVPDGVITLGSMKDCVFCAEPIQSKARKCKHCGSELS